MKFIDLLDEVGELPSPSLRGRGLKSIGRFLRGGSGLSPSLRGRGLKWQYTLNEVLNTCVALFARAWIEITFRFALNFADTVALFARAWIEI